MNKQHQKNPTTPVKVKLIKLAADVHKKDFKVCRQIGDQNIQPAQTFSPEDAFAWALKQREAAAQVVFCYEAGFSGFSLARKLIAHDVEAIVMCPQRLDERCKKVSTDRRDARAIAGRLDRYKAGNTEALVPVRIPTESQEDQRAVGRQRDQLLKARKQFEAQGRSLLYFKGLKCPAHWWQGSDPDWQATVKAHAWPAVVVELLAVDRRMALAAQQEIDTLTARIESAAAAHLPATLPQLPQGFGALSVELMRREVCDWSRFQNRRQVGSYFGLCAAESTSGDQQHQGSITKTGNPRCRHVLVELAWRVLNFQPEYRVVKKFAPRIAQTKPRSVARKKLIVAMARQIGVDLWRLYTGQTTLAKLGLVAKPGKDYVLRPA
jgi:transposase